MSAESSGPDEPPRFRINLSLPPEQRYLEVCTAFKQEMIAMAALLNESLMNALSLLSPRFAKGISTLLLRRVKEDEETRELKGIARATGIKLRLLILFNVALDMCMGCTSGGAAVKDGNGSKSKMVHFRTQDLGVPLLRRVIIHLQFVMTIGGPVIAESITYAGFVGVLTGVRKDFSVSLNMRPERNDEGHIRATLKRKFQGLGVFLGTRRSISSELRRMILPLPSRSGETEPRYLTYSDIVPSQVDKGQAKIKVRGKSLKTNACYLCVSDGNETTVLEKDEVIAAVRKSKDFIVVTNHDTTDHANTESGSEMCPNTGEGFTYSIHRKECAERVYQKRRDALARRVGKTFQDTASLRCIMGVDDIVELVQSHPVTNRETQFACVMDPKQGKVHWCGRWIKPISSKWIHEHQTER